VRTQGLPKWWEMLGIELLSAGQFADGTCCAVGPLMCTARDDTAGTFMKTTVLLLLLLLLPLLYLVTGPLTPVLLLNHR
jgi:hypothetical protein